MKWPPQKSWTSTRAKEGFRHFEVINYGGKGDERWVSLVAVLNKKVHFKVLWKDLKALSEWTSGWIQIPLEK